MVDGNRRDGSRSRAARNLRAHRRQTWRRGVVALGVGVSLVLVIQSGSARAQGSTGTLPPVAESGATPDTPPPQRPSETTPPATPAADPTAAPSGAAPPAPTHQQPSSQPGYSPQPYPQPGYQQPYQHPGYAQQPHLQPGYQPPYQHPGYAPAPSHQPHGPRDTSPEAPLADDAALTRGPFLSGLAGGLRANGRFEHYFMFGVEAGVFLHRVRLAARMQAPVGDTSDLSGENDAIVPVGYTVTNEERAYLIFGGSVGFAAVATQGFTLSPSIQYLRTDQSRYGHITALAFPMEWVNRGGFRIGFDIGVLYAFGGEILATCFGGGGACNAGDTARVDRETMGGFYANLILGAAFGGD